jgi:iron complex transport system substrate-binding protein
MLALFFSATFLYAETREYTDKMGRVVAVSLPVRRAVLFQTPELIPALGIWDKIVGISKSVYDNDLFKATNPDFETTVPSAGSGGDVNMEALLKQKPDVVITWSVKPDTVRFMERMGLKVITIFPDSISEFYDIMGMHGSLFEKEKKMADAIEAMESIFNLIKDRVSIIQSHEKRKVLWLGAKPTSVAGGIGITNDIIHLIGGVNPASSIIQGHGPSDVSLEQIVAWNPDVIFIRGYTSYSSADILSNSQWGYIKAVKEGRVYKAPDWSTWSPRLAPITLWAAIRTYPEYFKDIDLNKRTDAFYRKVFGIPFAKEKGFEGELHSWFNRKKWKRSEKRIPLPD